MDEATYSKKKETFLKSITLSCKKKNLLEEATRGQIGDDKWKKERKKRLTASFFGQICNLKSTTSTSNTVKQILYSEFCGNAATKYGIENESKAIRQFSELSSLTVHQCGLLIHNKYPFLAAIPDGLIGEDALIEVKCPASASELTVFEAIRQNKITYATIESDELRLKVNHGYMFQIQGQLQVSNRQLCYFVVWTPRDLQIQEIVRDDKFWKSMMENKLIKFYMECLLPELVDPRKTRDMPIRELYIKEEENGDYKDTES